MINITSGATECISLITTAESTATTTTTNTNTTSSSSCSTITTSTTSLTNNFSANNNISNNNSTHIINSSNNCNSLINEISSNLNISTSTLTPPPSNSAYNISIDSDSNDSPPPPSANPLNLSTRDISCIDLTEGDDEIEIITEKLAPRPLKKRKRDSIKTTSSTSTSCCVHRPCRNSLRESSTTSHNNTRASSLSPRTVHHRTSHRRQPLTPPLIPPPLLPVLSLQEQLSINPSRSDSFIVDLANSPSPSTSSSSNKNNAIDILMESVTKRKKIVENPQPPQETVRYKVVKCPICLEDDHKILAAGGEIVVTICGHVYCKSCLQQAIKTAHCCPNCRRKLTQRNFHRIFL